MAKLLSLIPWWVDVLLAALVAGGIGLAIHGYGRVRFQAGQDQMQGLWNVERIEQQKAALKAQAENAATTAKRLLELQEINSETRAQLSRERADADAARHSEQRLRQQLASYIDANRGAASSYSAVDGGGQAAGSPLDLLADLFRESDDAAGVLAAALDAAHTAGLNCQSRFDSLTAASE